MDLAISCDGPVRSVMLFSDRPATELGGQRVVVSRSSMTSVYLLQLLFEHVWRVRPEFVAGDAEAADLGAATDAPAARLVIGDAALMLASGALKSPYAYHYDLGEEWKAWTGLPFVFAVWVANRETAASDALRVHGDLVAPVLPHDDRAERVRRAHRPGHERAAVAHDRCGAKPTSARPWFTLAKAALSVAMLRA